MKKTTKLLAAAAALAVVMSLLSLFCGAAGKTYELIREDSIGGDTWDIVDGTWTGVLSGANAKAGALTREYKNGHLVVASTSDSQTNDADHWFGNYIGVGDLLKAGQTYTLTLKIKFNSNPNHVLHTAYPGSYDNIYVRYSEDSDLANWKVVTNGSDWQTVTYTFTVTDPAGKFLQIGPAAQVVFGDGYNNYWGGFCPGASLEIASAKLEGDLLKSDATSGGDNKPGGDKNPSTGSYVLPAVICMVAVAGCAVAVKKHGRR